MKYLIIGAGGTGGILGAYMTKAGKNVTLIARNAHLAAMKEHGLTVRHLWDETVETIPVQAENMESYEKKIETAGCDPRVCQGIFPGQHGTFYPEDRKAEHDRDPDPQHLRNR